MNVPSSIQIGFKALSEKLVKDSPSIFTGVAVVAVPSIIFLTIKGTTKAHELIEQEEWDKARALNAVEPQTLTKRETLRVVWKCYIPTAAAGALAIGSIIAVNKIHTGREVALATAYALTETTLKEYRKKVVDILGDKKEQKIQDALAEDDILKNPKSKSTVIHTGKGNVSFYDRLSGRYFEGDMESIRKAQNDLNSRIINGDGEKSLNEFYYELGLPSIDLGKDLGWNNEHGLIEVNFTAKVADDNTPCMVLYFRPDQMPYNLRTYGAC